jgi:hypothetical protein
VEPNPVTVRVGELWTGSIQCQSNASYYQRVTIASVLAPTYIETPSGMFIQVQSEDSVDNDYNDSVLAFVPTAHQA